MKSLNMKSPQFITVLIALFFSFSSGEQLIDEPIDPWQMQLLLGRGFDVAWAEFPTKIEAYDEDEMIAVAQKGFQTVRIRTNLPATEEDLFSFLDIQINHALKHGLIPVLAYHGGDVEKFPTVENMEAAAEWWGVVAERYQNISHKLLFNLIVEITDEIKNDHDKINELYRMCTEKIRATNPTRIILYAPKKISNPQYLPDLVIPESAGEYAMVEWHFYAAGPSLSDTLPNGSPNPKKWTTGTAEEKKLLTDKIDLATAWQEEQNIPTWVGAWMAGNYNKGDDYSVQEQIVFAEFMIESLENADIPWCINAIHKFYNEVDNRWIDSMVSLLNVISPGETSVSEVEKKDLHRISLKSEKGVISINSQAGVDEVLLFNLRGRVVKSVSGEAIQNVPTAGLSRGVYGIRIKSRTGVHSTLIHINQ